MKRQKILKLPSSFDIIGGKEKAVAIVDMKGVRNKLAIAR